MLTQLTAITRASRDFTMEESVFLFILEPPLTADDDKSQRRIFPVGVTGRTVEPAPRRRVV